MSEIPNAPLLVTAAIIRSEGRVLLAQRPLETKVEPGKWEFPGGKVEAGESPEESLIREIREELNLELTVERYFDFSSYVYTADEKTISVVLLSYLCRVEEALPRLTGVAEIKWASKADLIHFDYAKADIPLAHRLEKEWDQIHR